MPSLPRAGFSGRRRSTRRSPKAVSNLQLLLQAMATSMQRLRPAASWRLAEPLGNPGRNHDMKRIQAGSPPECPARLSGASGARNGPGVDTRTDWSHSACRRLGARRGPLSAACRKGAGMEQRGRVRFHAGADDTLVAPHKRAEPGAHAGVVMQRRQAVDIVGEARPSNGRTRTASTARMGRNSRSSMASSWHRKLTKVSMPSSTDTACSAAQEMIGSAASRHFTAR